MATATPPSDRPLRRDAERNRQRILAAARDAFAEEGLSVTLDEIARRAGVGVGTVYRRFPDKEQLIDALFEDQMAEFVALAEECLHDEDPWDGLVRFLEQACHVHACDRGFKEVALSGTHGLERIARARQMMFPLVSQLVARAQADGSLRPDVAADRRAAAAAHARRAQRMHARRRARGLAPLPRDRHRRATRSAPRPLRAAVRRADAGPDAGSDARLEGQRALAYGRLSTVRL